MRISHRHGLTLIELIVVIVVVGILAAIAVAGYGAVVERSRAEGVSINLLKTVGLEATALHLLGDTWSEALATTALDTGGPLPGADSAVWTVLPEGETPDAAGELGWDAEGTRLALTTLASPGNYVAVVVDQSTLVARDIDSDGDPTAALAAAS